MGLDKVVAIGNQNGAFEIVSIPKRLESHENIATFSIASSPISVEAPPTIGGRPLTSLSVFFIHTPARVMNNPAVSRSVALLAFLSFGLVTQPMLYQYSKCPSGSHNLGNNLGYDLF